MKKKLIVLAATLAFSVIFSSCSEDIKECEKNNTSDVEVVNSTGVAITVKVWIKNVGFTEEQQIANGASYTYTNVSATSAEFWIDLGPYWYWSEEYTLTPCEKFTFTWN